LFSSLRYQIQKFRYLKQKSFALIFFDPASLPICKTQKPINGKLQH